MSATVAPAATSTVVTATVEYQNPPPNGVRAYFKTHIDPKTGTWNKNIVPDEHDVQIENVRGKESFYTLDTAGFQFYNHPTKVTDFTDNKKIQEEYYPESIALIKELTGASRVVLFDHRHRLHQQGELHSPNRLQPATQVHVDQTPAASIACVHRHLPPEDVPALLQRRFQIINLWRPIGKPAYDWPLALCDYRTVNPKNDVFPVALIFPDHEGELMYVKYNPKHQWKYVPGMTPDEFVLIKCFDSVQDGSVAVFTPHTAFQDPTTPGDAPPRESIELRSLVFYD